MDGPEVQLCLCERAGTYKRKCGTQQRAQDKPPDKAVPSMDLIWKAVEDLFPEGAIRAPSSMEPMLAVTASKTW
eukprot:6646358-Lingulodinium_polyedra.AAC.1